MVFLGARIRSGIDYLLDLLQVRAAIQGARLVVTGRARWTTRPCAARPRPVAAAARAAGVTTVAVAGRSTLDPSALEPAGIARAYVLSDLEPDPERACASRRRCCGRWPRGSRPTGWLGTAGERPDAPVSAFDLVFRAPRVVTAAGEVARCVAVRDGRVAAIEPLAADLAEERTVTLADDEVLLPGLVDTHVHVNEPGRTEWEGFASATRAAAAGGSPPSSTCRSTRSRRPST